MADSRSSLYSISQLRELLNMARQLGFQDDVEHWESELRNMGEKP